MELPYAVEKTPLGRCERAGNAADFHRAHLQMGVVIIVMPPPSPTSSKLNVLQTSGHRRKRGFPRNSDFKGLGMSPMLLTTTTVLRGNAKTYSQLKSNKHFPTRNEKATPTTWFEENEVFSPSPSPSLIQVQPSQHKTV